MLGLRQYVEDESDRGVELSCDENLKLARELDACRVPDYLSLLLS
jgi:hypothetical protein